MKKILLILASALAVCVHADGDHEETIIGPQPIRGRFHYIIEDLTDERIVRRGVEETDSALHKNLLLPSRHWYREGVLHARTLKFGFVEFATPAAGQTFKFPGITFLEPAGHADTDADGIVDIAEYIVGTDPKKADTDGDGIPDGAEVQNGASPVSPAEASIGVIGALDTPGTAVDAAAAEGFVALADDSAGVALFRPISSGSPVLIRQFATPAPARSIAVGGARAVATIGGSGLFIIDLRETTFGETNIINLGGATARSIAIAGQQAFVGTQEGEIIRIDLAARIVLGRIPAGATVDDLQAQSGILFVAVKSALKIFSILPDDIEFLSSMPLTFGVAEGITSRHRISLGDGEVFVSSYPGFDRFSVSNPSGPILLGAARDQGPNSVKQIVPTGSGIGVATVGINPRADGTHDVWLYNLNDPTRTTNIISVLPTPAIAHAVALYGGLAYVADGEAGLQVVNYLPADRAGVAPTISLRPSFALTSPTNGVIESGALFAVRAQVADDVAVRSVEFFVDGALVTTDGNFPFEESFYGPNVTGSRFTIEARAIDVGGNSTRTAIIHVETVPDATAPRIVRATPRPNSFQSEIVSAAILFSEVIDQATIGAETVRIRAAGIDKILGTTDDFFVAGLSFEFDETTRTLNARPGSSLPPALYRLELTTAITDLAGLPLAAPFTSEFRIADLTLDTDADGVPNDVELVLGTDPTRADSDNNGVQDGNEDFDRDGLTNAQEISLGLNPTLLDSNNNGINDGNEDIDGDTLATRTELIFGTNPLRFDTDGDTWSDEAETTAGSNALIAGSTPKLFTVANPMLELIAPRSVPLDGSVLGTTLAQPPVEIIAPRVVFDGAFSFGTTVANPPIEVVAPAAIFISNSALGTVLATPPVEVLAPRVVFEGFGAFGTTLANPPLEILAPATGDTEGIFAPVLGQPPVLIEFQTQP